jgi:hypothetical protein
MAAHFSECIQWWISSSAHWRALRYHQWR